MARMFFERWHCSWEVRRCSRRAGRLSPTGRAQERSARERIAQTSLRGEASAAARGISARDRDRLDRVVSRDLRSIARRIVLSISTYIEGEASTFRAIYRTSLASGAAAALASCQLLGPTSISAGRGEYNAVIQSTSKNEALSNIVRVYKHEPTLFMDVTEVDAVASFSAAVTGSATNIGATAGTSGGTLAGQVGSVGGALQYSETPTIRYQPLLGPALVAQLVTPISVDSLGLLTDSDWPAASVLDFGTDYLTPEYDEFFLALNAIVELSSDQYNALEFVAAKSELTKEKTQEPVTIKSTAGSPVVQVQTTPPKPATNDALVIYLLPLHPHELHRRPQSQPDQNADLQREQRYLQLWVRLLRIYAGTQPQPEILKQGENGCRQKNIDLANLDKNISTIIRSPTNVTDTLACLRQWIELRASPVPYKKPDEAKPASKTDATAKLVTHAPIMRTMSALGILKAATEAPGPQIEFVTPEAYQHITNITTHPWNRDLDNLNYYTLLASDEDSLGCPEDRKKIGCDNPNETNEDKAITAKISRWVKDSTKRENEKRVGGLFSYEEKGDDVLGDNYDMLDDYHIKINRRLGHLRRYILIVVQDKPPTIPIYAEYSYGGNWYYIAGNDTVSQKNFRLLSLFLTMMAIPSQTPPLTPVISVGG